MSRGRLRECRLALGAAVLGTLALGAAAPAQKDNPQERAGWWLKTYGPLTGRDARLQATAITIFERVAAAADKSANRQPRLVLLDADADPWALALPDGSILLTRGALVRTLQSAPLERGEARLAFLLGHELSHLAKDDFWRVSAFAPAPRAADAGRATAGSDLPATTDDDRRKAELAADRAGLFYALSAGYPLALLEEPEAFFVDWARFTGIRADAAHPAPKARAAFLRKELDELDHDLDYFRFGARLLTLGRYEDALLLLERFRDDFPSREVLTDIGLAHHQLALRELARCDGQVAMRFALPIEADPVTLAERSRLRGAPDPADLCRASPTFREHARAARDALELATERDPRYLPARVDLIATHLLSGRNAEAIVVADEALKLDAGSSDLLIGRALGVYLFGLESRLETTDTALGLLEQAIARAPRSAVALYDRARILDERGRTAAARDAWRALLAVEDDGARAEIARQRLELGPPAARPATATLSPAAPPLPLGDVAHAPADRLSAFTRQEFVLGEFRGAFLREAAAPNAAAKPARAGVTALQIGSSIELVEVPLAFTADADPEGFGRPRARMPTPRGEVVVYGDRALVYEGRRPKAMLHFAAAPRRVD